MAKEKNVLIVCGEPSGDLHAANLVTAIKQVYPEVNFSGIGGELSRKAGVNIYCDIKGMAVLGLFDVLKKLPAFFSLRSLLLKKIKEDRPDAVILVDFSGFNLRLAKKINKSLPVIYYISPQVWASRPGRVRTIKKYISKMIVLFKFEEKFYRERGVEADFAGHPLLDIVRPAMTKKELLAGLKLPADKATLALLPGSRMAEISNILPVMLGAAKIICNELPDTQFIIAKSPQVDWEVYNSIIHKFPGLEIKIVEGKTYDCLEAADFALVASGTATLETTIMQKPFLIIYRLGLLNYLLYLPQVRLPYIGMANIVAGREIIPEFIQYAATPRNIAREAIAILRDPARLAQMKTELTKVKASLGDPGAALRAAKIIIDYIK